MAFVVQAVLSPCVLLFNTVLVDPFKKGFMKFKNISYPLLDYLLAGKIQRCLKEFKNGKLQAAKLQSFLADLSYELYSFLFNLPSLLPQLFSSQRLENVQPMLPTELLVNLAWTPLVLLDVAVQVCLLTYTMAFQCALYLLYVCLFVLCHLVGDHSRLEKTGVPMKRIVVKPRAKKADIVNDACRTFTFFNMDSYIFNDVEEKEKEPSHSDESGYLSESELLVDDSD
jgi:hypothetical protein